MTGHHDRPMRLNVEDYIQTSDRLTLPLYVSWREERVAPFPFLSSPFLALFVTIKGLPHIWVIVFFLSHLQG